MKTLELKELGLSELKMEEMMVNGGTVDAGDILSVGLGIVGVVALFVAPPSAFLIVPASTAAGVGLGQAISGLFD